MPITFLRDLFVAIIFTIIFIYIIVYTLVFVPLSHLNKNCYYVLITQTSIHFSRYGEERYLVYTKLPNGTIRVFENVNSLIEGKFNSSDIHATLESGKWYRINTYGFRWHMLACYENILTVQEIISPN